MERGRYAPTSGVRFPPEKILRLTTFVPWKCVDSVLHTWGLPMMTSTTPSYMPLVAVVTDREQTML